MSDFSILFLQSIVQIQDGLSQFTMRDLGLVRTQSFHDTYEPRFNDREEALEHYYYASRLSAGGVPVARAS